MPLVAQSCDRDDENETNKGNDNSESRAITLQPIIKNPMSTQIHLPTHLRWLQTVRKLLRSLSEGFVRDEEMLDLNITLTELQGPLAGVSSVAVTTIIIAFFRTKTYHSEMRCLDAMGFQRSLDAMGFQRRAGRSKRCGAYVSALLVSWTEVLAKEAGNHVEVLREHPLHIKADSRTRGIISTLTIVSKGDAQQRPLISFIQRKQAIDKGLTCTELYTLLALAAKKHLAQPFVEDTIIYQVDMLSFYSHWVQRITANIPSSYLRSLIQGQRELVGRIEIWRGPVLNFLEEASQRQILQGVFECCELLCTSSRGTSTPTPAAIQNPRKRSGIVENEYEIEGKRQRTYP